MKKFLFVIIFLAISNLYVISHAEDIAREEALEEFDNEVNGAKKTTNTVRPLSHEELEDARAPMWDYDEWDDPFFGPGGSMDYELWRSEQDD